MADLTRFSRGWESRKSQAFNLRKGPVSSYERVRTCEPKGLCWYDFWVTP